MNDMASHPSAASAPRTPLHLEDLGLEMVMMRDILLKTFFRRNLSGLNDTAEALRVTPISARTLLLGKATIVYGLTVWAGSIWAGSLFAAQAAGWMELPQLLGESQVFTLPNTLVLLGMVALLGAQLTALSMAVAAWAPNMRQAGVASTPLFILVLAPTGLAAAPGVDLSPGLAFVPIANVTLGARAWLAGDLQRRGTSTLQLFQHRIDTTLVLGARFG